MFLNVGILWLISAKIWYLFMLNCLSTTPKSQLLIGSFSCCSGFEM